MRKNIIIIILSLIAVGVFISCNKNRTYAQHLDDEKKAIQLFINKNDLKVLKEYPKDSIFKANEFYFDDLNGIYYNVIDPGNGRRIRTGERVFIRFKGLKYIASKDTSTYSNFQSLDPEALVYGNTSTYPSAAWVTPIKNVSDRARVRLIVPFKMGLQSDQQPAYKTAYFEELRYQFEDYY